jgi:hypothetical protein
MGRGKIFVLREKNRGGFALRLVTRNLGQSFLARQLANGGLVE